VYEVTEKAREKVIEGYFDSLEPLHMCIFPAKEKKKYITLLYIIECFEKERYYTEKEVNQILIQIYFDFVTLRRYLVDYQLLSREKDGSKYWVTNKTNSVEMD